MPQTDQYPISDLLIWMNENTLVLNAEFQRRSVWPPSAKSYLIDTILHDRPMPNIYVRTKTDLVTRRNYREVVDGQQRLRAIQEFADGDLLLSSQAKDFMGLRYEKLDDEQKRTFLQYKIGVVQLFNASDAEVLDIFQRINAYGLHLNPQEKRHGKWQGAFRTAVVDTSKLWRDKDLWETYNIVGLRDRVRMDDDELVAQMFGVVLEGVKDGGQPYIDRLYRDYDKGIPKVTAQRVNEAVKYIVGNFQEIMGTGLARAPHFLMLFAAVCHALQGIPTGDIEKEKKVGSKLTMPPKDPQALSDKEMVNANLGKLADILEMDAGDVPPQFSHFKYASAGSTQRIKSRAVRFVWLYKALLPGAI